MKQLSFDGKEYIAKHKQPRKKYRPQKLKAKASKVIRSSYGTIVPIPAYENGDPIRYGDLQIYRRTDGLYILFDHSKETGLNVIRTFSQLQDAVYFIENEARQWLTR